MKELNSDKQIENAADFNDYAVIIWEGFLETFTKDNGLIRDINEADVVEDNIAYMYTRRGTVLAERMRDRLAKVGCAHFGEDEIDIQSSYYQEQ